MKIFRNNVAIHNLAIDERTTIKRRLMVENSLNLSVSVSATAPLDVKIGDYTDLDDERYVIMDEPIYSLRNGVYEYTILMRGNLHRLEVYMMPNEGRSEWFYYGSVVDHINRVIAALNTKEVGWSVVLPDVSLIADNSPKSINYLNMSILSAFHAICSAENGWGLEFDVVGKVIKFAKEIKTPTTMRFEYGKGKGLYELTRGQLSGEKIATRIIGYGGTANMPVSQRLSFQSINQGKDYIENNVDLYGLREASVYFDHIYPRLKDATIVSDAVQIEAGRANWKVVTTLDFDLKQQIAEGAVIIFQTGDCVGTEFEIMDYDHPTKTLTFKEVVDETGAEDGGTYILPNANRKPKSGDQFVLVNILMPDSYVEAAKVELKQAVTDEATKRSTPQRSYSVKCDPRYFKSLGIRPIPGDACRLIDTPNGVDYTSRIVEISYPLIYPNSINLVLADTVQIPSAVVMAKSIKEIKTKLGILDRAQLSEDQLRRIFHPLGGSVELDMSARNVTAAKVVAPNIESPNFGSGIVRSGYQILTDPVTGKSTLSISKIAADELALDQLTIQRVQAIGGVLILSQAYATIVRVENLGSAFRCYYIPDGGLQLWKAGDQALCKNVFRYYWRLVTSVSELVNDRGEHWFNLSATQTDGSGVPTTDDEIVLLGCRGDDLDRRSALVLSSGTLGYPNPFSYYENINSFSLVGKENIRFGRDSMLKVKSFSILGDNGDEYRVPCERGVWMAGHYAYYDRVSHNGSLWLCIADGGTEIEPSDTADGIWLKTVAKGGDGADGADGKDGVDGKDGKGITSIVEYYAVSTSNTSAPSSWKTTVPTLTSTNKYLWNYERITYTDNSTFDTTKRVVGVYGDMGKGIKSIDNRYLASDQSTGVTTATAGWTASVQSTSTEKRYLWNYEITTYSDDTTTASSPCVIGVHGQDGETPIIYELSPSATAVRKDVSGVLSPTTVSCRAVLRKGNEREVIGIDPPIEFEGRNLVRNSGKKLQTNAYLMGVVDLSRDLVDDEVLTVSIDATIDASQVIYVALHPSSAQLAVAPNNGNGTYSATFKFKKRSNYPSDVRNRLQIYNYRHTGNLVGYVNRVKLERGNKATDWSPAPEDYTIKRDGQAYTAGAEITPTDTINWTLHEPTAGKEIDRKSTIFDATQYTQGQIVEAKQVADQAKARTDAAATDGMITREEKLTLKRDRDAIIKETVELVAIANSSGIAQGIITSLNGARDGIVGYLNTTMGLNSMNTDTQLPITYYETYASVMATYAKSLQELSNAISQKQVDSVEIGVANLFRDTKSIATPSIWNANGGTPAPAKWGMVGEFQAMKIEGDWGRLWQKVSYKKNQPYTFSCWVRKDSSIETARTYMNLWIPSDKITINIATLNDVVLGQNQGSVLFTYLTDEFQRLVVCFTPKEDLIDTDEFRVEFAVDNYQTKNPCGVVYGYKLEKGNRATDWSPAHEDTQAQIMAAKVAALQDMAVKTGYDSWDAMVDAAEQGQTITIGGYLNPVLIEAEAIVAQQGFVDALRTREFTAEQATVGKLMTSGGQDNQRITIFDDQINMYDGDKVVTTMSGQVMPSVSDFNNDGSSGQKNYPAFSRTTTTTYDILTNPLTGLVAGSVIHVATTISLYGAPGNNMFIPPVMAGSASVRVVLMRRRSANTWTEHAVVCEELVLGGSRSVVVDKKISVNSGNYALRFEITASPNSNGILSSVSVGATSFSFDYLDSSNMRALWGSNGWGLRGNRDNYFHVEFRNGEMFLTAKGTLDMPGVLLWAGANYLGSATFYEGAKKHATYKISKVTTGNYRIYHSIGHADYTVEVGVESTSPCVWCYKNKTTTSVEIVIYNMSSTPVDKSFTVTLTGKN